MVQAGVERRSQPYTSEFVAKLTEKLKKLELFFELDMPSTDSLAVVLSMPDGTIAAGTQPLNRSNVTVSTDCYAQRSAAQAPLNRSRNPKYSALATTAE